MYQLHKQMRGLPNKEINKGSIKRKDLRESIFCYIFHSSYSSRRRDCIRIRSTHGRDISWYMIVDWFDESVNSCVIDLIWFLHNFSIFDPTMSCSLISSSCSPSIPGSSVLASASVSSPRSSCTASSLRRSWIWKKLEIVISYYT